MRLPSDVRWMFSWLLQTDWRVVSASAENLLVWGWRIPFLLAVTTLIAATLLRWNMPGELCYCQQQLNSQLCTAHCLDQCGPLTAGKAVQLSCGFRLWLLPASMVCPSKLAPYKQQPQCSPCTFTHVSAM
jgi:hypothetical protein